MITRHQVLNFRVHAQQLDRPSRTSVDTTILDFGVQETGPDGAKWALANRGVDLAALPDNDLIVLWTVRGAPHRYRRADTAAIATAIEPYSDTDAGKRIITAAEPLNAAGIGNLAALDEIADLMRGIVTEPTTKGDVSKRLADLAPPPYLVYCQRCGATHAYESLFRLAATRAGLELAPDSSPPILQRIPDFSKASAASQRFDLIRCYLRLLGPATPRHIAEYIEAPLTEIKAHWPDDAVEVTVDGKRRWLLEADVETLHSADADGVRLLGPYDLFLQARDRQTLVPDRNHAKQLWRSPARPGAVLVDGEPVGTWRARKSGEKFGVTAALWRRLSHFERNAVNEQAELLATYRGIPLASVEFE